MIDFSVPFIFAYQSQELGGALEAFVANAKPMAECRTFADALNNLVPGIAPEDGSFGRGAARRYFGLCWRAGIPHRHKTDATCDVPAFFSYNRIWRVVYFDPKTLIPVGAQIRFLDEPTYHNVVGGMPKELYDMGAVFTIDEVDIRVPAA